MKDSYTVGRQTSGVDFQFIKQCFSTKLMNHVSKIHFIITRENLGTLGHVVFITDTSSNGTFLNGEKIGKDCRWVLSNNDKIAVISSTNNGNNLIVLHMSIYYFNILIKNGFILIYLVYTFTDKSFDFPNLPQKVRQQFAVYGVLGTGAFGEVRLAFEKVSILE